MINTPNQEPSLGSKENPIFVTTPEEFDKVKSYKYISFNCIKCNTPNTIYIDNRTRLKQRRLLCTSCSRKQTNLEKYGVEHVLQSTEIMESMKASLRDKYGVDNVSKLQDVKSKKEQTCLDHFGVKTNVILPKFIEHRKECNLKNFGVENPFMSEVVQEKIRETNIAKFGFSSPMKSKIIQLKAQQTNITRRGVPYPTQSEDVIKKSKETFYRKYKAYHFPHGIYLLDGYKFDSTWEVAFYVYHRDLGFDISRNTEPIPFIYDGKTHFYHPDFKVGTNLYEIKGSQFFKSDGTMCCPYNHDFDELFEAKRQCGLANNVIFIDKNLIKPYIEYTVHKYGKSFFSSLRLR